MESPALKLREWKPVELDLTARQAAELQALEADIRVEVTAFANRYRVTPGSVVGVARTASLEVLIEPKIEVERFFELLSYARGLKFSTETVVLDPRQGVAEAFARLFVNMVGRLMGRGPIQGYVYREEALSSFRGRLRAGDQARRRFGLPLPVEVSYDDFTVDVEENRLLKAALLRLSCFRFEDPSLQRRISEVLFPLAEVTAVRYPPRAIPRVSYTRLNQHYRGAVELARLLLQNASVELRAGNVLVGQFLVNMNDLFEDFIFEAIRRRLPAGPVWLHGKRINLDEEERVRMAPDLSWWHGRECLFVGDAKYKRTGDGESNDLYQLLAYCQATGRSSGKLIYAEGGETTHVVLRSGVRLEVAGVDLGAPWEQLEARIDEIAGAIAADAGVLPTLAAA